MRGRRERGRGEKSVESMIDRETVVSSELDRARMIVFERSSAFVSFNLRAPYTYFIRRCVYFGANVRNYSLSS